VSAADSLTQEFLGLGRQVVDRHAPAFDAEQAAEKSQCQAEEPVVSFPFHGHELRFESMAMQRFAVTKITLQQRAGCRNSVIFCRCPCMNRVMTIDQCRLHADV
jgi:hypothetical protein